MAGSTVVEAFGAFALQCKEMGYRAFKIHGWGNGPIARESAAVVMTPVDGVRVYGAGPPFSELPERGDKICYV